MARCAHEKMAVLPGPIRCGLARFVRTIGAWGSRLTEQSDLRLEVWHALHIYMSSDRDVHRDEVGPSAFSWVRSLK